MQPLEVDKPPLDVPRAERRGSHWIEPKLVAEIAFTEFTSDGILRHPLHRACARTRRRREVRPRRAQSFAKPRRGATTAAADFGAKISNPDRVIFPATA